MNVTLKTALLQLIPCADDQDANIKKGADYCREAKKLGADIAVFPEMWNIGYTPFTDKILKEQYNQDNITTEDVIKKLTTHAIKQDSKFLINFQTLAEKLDMAILITYLENKNGDLRNTASIINRHAKIVLTYAKVHTVDFTLERSCTQGDDFYVCDLDTQHGNIKVGVMICFDRNFPESARILMLKGAELILTPNAGHADENRIEQFKCRAFENMLGVAMTNYPDPLFNGHSCAFDGMVRNINGSSRNPLLIEADETEGIFLANFDITALRDYRQREIWGNAYRRPSYYQLLTSSDASERK